MDTNTRNALGAVHERFGAIRWLFSREREKLSSFPAIIERVNEAEAAVDRVREGIDRILAAADTEKNRSSTVSDAVPALLNLNRQLMHIGGFLRATAADVRPRLDAQLADQKDPLYDYEIVAQIDYTLREDDPEYDDEDDNILTTREEILSSDDGDALEDDYFSGCPCCPPGLEQEPHCWMFHDLCDHGYGHGRPKLSLRDRLRVGKIFIDVQIGQQYCFDIQAGKWVKAWRRDGANAEQYVDIEKDERHGR